MLIQRHTHVFYMHIRCQCNEMMYNCALIFNVQYSAVGTKRKQLGCSVMPPTVTFITVCPLALNGR